jgi:small subunit ribosomal protein S14
MAIKSQIAKSKRKPKYSTRVVRRCWRCGRNHGYIRQFDMCRICFRELAERGEVPGFTRSSW